jgi:hypothetical protein
MISLHLPVFPLHLPAVSLHLPVVISNMQVNMKFIFKKQLFPLCANTSEKGLNI